MYADSDINEFENSYVIFIKCLAPPFLNVHKFQVETKTNSDEVGDLGRICRKENDSLKRLRERTHAQFGERFWEVNGTKMGDAVKKTRSSFREKEVEKTGQDQFNEFFKDSFKQDEEKIQKTKEELPIFAVKNQFISLVKQHQVLVVIGHTGCGKTTQMPQYLYEAGFGENQCMIGCTQPRRVAAVTVSKRVAEEMKTDISKLVGYRIRFEDCTSAETKIKFMTDGILLRETLNETELDRYSCIIMDEAHERSINTDILFGILKKTLRRRNDFRLIVTSATIEGQKFADFFGSAPVFEIPGKLFPVDNFYAKSLNEDYVDAAVNQILSIHASGDQKPEDSGDECYDILCFMTGAEDVDAVCTLAMERLEKVGNLEPLVVLPLYSHLSTEVQARVFQPSIYRKVIVATNIAETSITVVGIRYVIDSGLHKQKVYNTKIGLDSLHVCPISKANAMQRSGRAGRTAHGECYRLYTESVFVSELAECQTPEIQRTNLCNVILTLKSLGIVDIMHFDFMDAPPMENIKNSTYSLWILGALNHVGKITKRGRAMSRFPLDPALSRVILEALKPRSRLFDELVFYEDEEALGRPMYECVEEVVVILSMLSVPNVYFRPRNQQDQADKARQKFCCPESDHLSYLNLYLHWQRRNYSSKFCSDNFVNYRAMKKVKDILEQLLDISVSMTEKKETKDEEKKHVPRNSPFPRACHHSNWLYIRKLFCHGFFYHASKMKKIGEYYNLRTKVLSHLHPSSALQSTVDPASYIIYHEVLLTTREYMNVVTEIDPRWLPLCGPMFFQLRPKKLVPQEEQAMIEFYRIQDIRFDYEIKQAQLEMESTEMSNTGSSTRRTEMRASGFRRNQRWKRQERPILGEKRKLSFFDEDEEEPFKK